MAQTHGRASCVAIACAAKIFDTPAGVADEIAYVGAERQDRYEHYEWNFRAREVVGTGRAAHRHSDARAHARRSNAASRRLLARLDIGALAERRFLTLSYGERRLVLIARALASRPKLLLLDEVANGLDARNHARFLHWLAGTARSSMPWVFATHRRADVPDSMTHLLELEQGAVKRSGAMRASGARELLQQEARAFHSRQARARAPAAQAPRCWWRCGTRTCTSTKRTSCTASISKCAPAIAGWCMARMARASRRCCGRSMAITPSRRAAASCAPASCPACRSKQFKLRTAYVAPHLQTWHAPRMPVMEVVASGRYASIGLNDAITASDRKHAERALRRFGMFALREPHARRDVLWPGAPRIVRARLGARAARSRCSMSRSPGWIARRARISTRRLNRWLAEGGSCVIATHHREEWPAHTTHVLELERGACVTSHALGEA